MTFIVSPRKPKIITDVRIDSGIETAMIRVLRQLPRKSKLMSAVRHPAMTASQITPLSAPSQTWTTRRPKKCLAMEGLSDSRLRNKLEKDHARPAYILTVWGVGYKFADA